MFKTILAAVLLFPLPSFAQQVNEYDVCTRYRETYVPGYYDGHGNYVAGRVRTESYRVPCDYTSNQYDQYNQPVKREPVVRRRQCDPTKTALGAILGGGVAASMSRGDGYKWSVPLGAFIGGVGFGC